MKTRSSISTLLGAAALLLWLVPAHAQQEPEPTPEPPVTEPTEPTPQPPPEQTPAPATEPTPVATEPVPADPSAPSLMTPYGMEASVGGGIIGFTDGDANDFTDVGGSWQARLLVGTRTMWGVEVAYTGAAHSVDALGLDNDAILVSTGLEALGRFNFLTQEWQPYLVAGLGWRRYDVTNADFNTSAVSDSDNLLEIPLGGGLAYRSGGLVIDLRLMFRAAADEDLIQAAPFEDEPSLDTFEGSLRVGWEF